MSTGVDRFHYLMGAIVAGIAGSLAVLFRLEHISIINLHPVLFSVQCVLPLAIVAAYCHWAGFAKLREGCLLVIWACLLINLLPLPTYAAARTAFPLQDLTLARIDGFIGINVGVIVAWTRSRPVINHAAMSAYSLLFPFVFSAAVIPAVAGKLKASREFLLATALASVIAACSLAVFPASGPWTIYHFEPYWNQAFFIHELGAIRSSGQFIANPEYTSGLVTFPSFHVALSVLCAYALWEFRRFRLLLVAVSAAIAASTLMTGWHYAADGIAGVIASAASLYCAKQLLRYKPYFPFRYVSTAVTSVPVNERP